MSISLYNETYDKTYNEISQLFDINKDTSWEQCLEFDCNFKKQGKQGIVGLMNVKKEIPLDISKKETPKDISKKLVFKFSRYINYLPIHEYIVTKSLGEIYHFCPFFCRSYGIDNILMDSDFRTKENPFVIEKQYPIEHFVHWMEYIEGKKFSSYILSEKVNDNIIFSIIKQVLLAMCIAQNKKRFAHYDLHSNNIVLRRINPNIVFLFVINENIQYLVPSYGYCPVIIDYGYSYIQDIENKPFWNTLAFTDVGFLSDRFDNIADPKLFTVTVANEFTMYRRNKITKKFINIIENTYGDLKIEMDSGWDNIEETSASNAVLDKIDDVLEISKTFRDYGHYCIDLIQSLIILPLHKQNYKDVKKNYTIFLKEFIKIERKIGSSFYNLYILKKIVDVTRDLREYYIGVNEKVEIELPSGELTSDLKTIREYALKVFTSEVKKIITSVSKFYNPTDIHYEKMLCSLILLSKNTEGMLFNIMEKLMVKKEKQYKKIPLKNIEELYYMIEYNIPSNVTITKNTIICVLDSVKEKSFKYKVKENPDILNNLDEINKNHSLDLGKKIFSLCNK